MTSDQAANASSIPSEKLIPLIEAIEAETGRRVSLPTAIRWCSDGRGGVRLRRQRIGGRWYTCRVWVAEFIAATHEAAEARVAKPETFAVVAGKQKAREAEKQAAADKLKRKLKR